MRIITNLFIVFAIISCDKPKKQPLSQIVSGEQIVAYTFTENGKFGLLDSSLHVVLEPKYDYIFSYQDYGVIKTDNGGERIDGGDYIHYETGKIGLIDIKGNILFEPQFDEIYINSKSARGLIDGMFGFINLEGRFLIKPRFKEALSETNGVAPVKEDSLWGIIEMTGEYLIHPKFIILSEFRNGISYFQRDPTGNYGFINTEGHILIDSLNGVGTFQYGFGPINIGYKWGVIDEKGNVVIKPQYDESINVMKRDDEIWVMQYDDKQKDWKKIERLKAYNNR